MGEEIKDKSNYRKMEKQVQDRDTGSYLFKCDDFVESAYHMTKNEQRLVYLASKKLKQLYVHSNVKSMTLVNLNSPKKLRTVRVYVTEFRKAFNLSSHNLYEILKNTAKSLDSKKLMRFHQDGFISKQRFVMSCKYIKSDNCIEIEFAPELMLDLLSLKGKFGMIDYNIVKFFKSSYSFRLYELLKNYVYRGSRTIELQELKIKLGIFDNTKYKSYFELRRTVIERAIEDINEYSNLIVEFEGVRYGRRYGAMKFLIWEKKSYKNFDVFDVDAVDESQVEFMREITGYVFSTSQIAKLTNSALDAIRKYKINMSFYDYIQYEVNIVRAYSNVARIDDYFSYLNTALESYWNENTIDNSKQLLENFENVEEKNIQLSFKF